MDKNKYWEDKVFEQRKSGLSIGAYCRKENVSSSTFDYWKRKLEKGTEPERKFVNLTPLSNEKPIRIELRSGTIIQVPDAATLSAVLRVLNVA